MKAPAKRIKNKKIEASLSKIKALSVEKERENWDFRAFLKYEYTSAQLDRVVHKLYQEISTEIDCTKCNNCCRETYPVINQSDVKSAAKRLQMLPSEFIEQYLVSEAEGFKFNQEPCPLLYGGRCKIYGAHPKDCQSFPHLHKKDIMGRLMAVVENYGVCPIVFNVYEALKKELWPGMHKFY
ncbi:YkgJ family cysteine cluster protein [Desulforegula conservatrix]|uniref:YkgJ family cysteine cluster protein n=1 Tax=Desulforegula conservatrix TaxID=153026 RepID=UPI000685D481|nr:YkgJ family cysteine cluster protein [Desulforegula conservatrix]